MEPFDSKQAAIEGILRILGDSIDFDDLDSILLAENADLLPLRRQFSKEINKLKASRIVLGRLHAQYEEILRKTTYRDHEFTHSVYYKYDFYLRKLLECDKLAQQIYDTLPKDPKNAPNHVSQPVQQTRQRAKGTPKGSSEAESASGAPGSTDREVNGASSPPESTPTGRKRRTKGKTTT